MLKGFLLEYGPSELFRKPGSCYSKTGLYMLKIHSNDLMV